MRALLPALLVLVACSEPPGLTLEVVPLDDSIEYVEVYLADHCPNCPDSMAAPMMRAHVANIYQTDYPMLFSASTSEPEKWKNGHAFFRVTSRVDGDDSLAYLLVIGFDANKTPKAINRFSGVLIPKSYGEYWQVELDEPVVPLTDTSTQESIAIWGANRTGPRCVLVVNSDGRADGVVPADDPDCDGVAPAQECAPYSPNAVNAAPNIEHASCVVPMPGVGTGSYICLLGGLPCTEGQLTQGCEPLDVDYCAPMKACGCGSDWACVATKLTDPDISIIAHEACAIAMQPNGAECPDSSRRQAEIDLGGLLSNSGGTKCTSIRVHDLSVPIAPFVDKLDVSGATLELANFQEPCKIVMKWSGNYTRLGPQTLALDVALDNGKHLVLPFLVHGAGTDGCSVDTSCHLSNIDGAESMLLCTKPAVDTTTCTSTTSGCLNGAVACGARCCGKGEACVDGECRCGDGTHCADGGCISTTPNPSSTGCGDVCCGSGPGTPACL